MYLRWTYFWILTELFVAVCQNIEQTEWQRARIQRVQDAGSRQSAAATSNLQERLGAPATRQALRDCGVAPEVSELPADQLLELLRAEVSVSEVVSGFTAAASWGPGMSIHEGEHGLGYFESQWEAGVRAGTNWSKSWWWQIMDSIEVQLYGLKPFARQGAPKTQDEARERAPYFAVNLYKVDAGSPLYGDVSVVLSTTIGSESSLISAVDSGGWNTLCAEGGRHNWFNVNCSAYGRNESGMGTFQHFDHLLLQNDGYWHNRTLERLACRTLSPWGMFPLHGSDLIHYFEALPLARIPYPAGIKFLIGSFRSLFGTKMGSQLQRWCISRGWVLVWSLGINIDVPEDDPIEFWSAPSLKQMLPASQRIMDIAVLTHTSAVVNMSVLLADGTAVNAFNASWKEVSQLRSTALRKNETITHVSWAAEWQRLAFNLPKDFQKLEPLRSKSCSDITSCIGTTPTGTCVCYFSNKTQQTQTSIRSADVSFRISANEDELII